VFHGNASEDCVSQFPRTSLQSLSGADSGVQKSTEAYPQRLFPNGGVTAICREGNCRPVVVDPLLRLPANEKSFPMQDLLRLQKGVPQHLNGIGPRREFGGGQCINLKSRTCQTSAIASTNSRQSSPTRLLVFKTRSHHCYIHIDTP
jgi:hypothetical protein